MKTLLLTVEYPSRASYYIDWREAFCAAPEMQVTVRNLFQARARRQVVREVGDYELIVLLHSCTADTLAYAAPVTTALQARRGRLVAFVGNEVNLPWTPLGEKIAWLRKIAPDIIATQLLQEAGDWLYAATGSRVLAVPHALNPTTFHPTIDQAERTIDIGARSYRYLAYIGDDDRNGIYDFFRLGDFRPPLKLDFSTEDRLDRDGWMQFLNRCKATIATEAGSWFLERDDRTVLEIRAWAEEGRSGLRVAPDGRLAKFARRLPYPVKARLRQWLRRGPIQLEAVGAERLEFAAVYERFFKERPKTPVYGKAISSRHFDAIGTKTLQILFPGRYGDILVPGEDYVALERDFSNIAAVLDVLRNTASRRRIVDQAYDRALAGHTYRHRIERLLTALGSKPVPRGAGAGP